MVEFRQRGGRGVVSQNPPPTACQELPAIFGDTVAEKGSLVDVDGQVGKERENTRGNAITMDDAETIFWHWLE